jgi:hypothetical protein
MSAIWARLLTDGRTPARPARGGGCAVVAVWPALLQHPRHTARLVRTADGAVPTQAHVDVAVPLQRGARDIVSPSKIRHRTWPSRSCVCRFTPMKPPAATERHDSPSRRRNTLGSRAMRARYINSARKEEHHHRTWAREYVHLMLSNDSCLRCRTRGQKKHDSKSHGRSHNAPPAPSLSPAAPLASSTMARECGYCCYSVRTQYVL